MRQSLLLPLAALLSAILGARASAAHELTCPPMPDKITQVNHDFLAEVQIEVSPLSKLKLGQVGAKTEGVAKNLFGKFPNLNRIMVAEMVSGAYCSMIR